MFIYTLSDIIGIAIVILFILGIILGFIVDIVKDIIKHKKRKNGNDSNSTSRS